METKYRLHDGSYGTADEAVLDELQRWRMTHQVITNPPTPEARQPAARDDGRASAYAFMRGCGVGLVLGIPMWLALVWLGVTLWQWLRG